MTGAASTIGEGLRPRRGLAQWTEFRHLLDHRIAWVGCIAAVGALQLALILTHTPWLDEWQALLIVVQSPDVSALLENLRYEGHPPLWYAFLWLLAQAIPFDWVLTAASLVIAGGIQALIVLRAPFPRVERLLLAFGEIALFEYGTLARSLALGALVMLMAAALWRSRWVWLPIALLPICDFQFGVVALILVALRWRANSISPAGLAAFTVSGLAAAWTVRPVAGRVPAEPLHGVSIELADFIHRMGGLLLPFQTFKGQVAWDGYPPFLTGSVLGALLLVWMWQRYSGDRAQKLAVFGLIAVCCAVSLSIYALHFRHLTVIAWLVVVLAWIFGQPNPTEQARWRAWLVVGALCGIATATVALTRPFDAAPAAVQAMTRLDDGRRPWLVHPPRHAVALAANLGHPVFVPAKGCMQTFIRWDRPDMLTRPRAMRRAMAEWAERYGESFLVIDPLPAGVPADVFVPLTGKLHGYNGQGYVIGILAPGRRPREFQASPCVAGLRPLP